MVVRNPQKIHTPWRWSWRGTVECSEAEASHVAAGLEGCFRDAGDEVLNGHVQLRLETGIVRFPEHYCDDAGKEIWDMVLEGMTRPKVATRAKFMVRITLTRLPRRSEASPRLVSCTRQDMSANSRAAIPRPTIVWS